LASTPWRPLASWPATAGSPRAFSSSCGAGDNDGDPLAPPKGLIESALQAELAALNRELADVFGEQPPDGPGSSGGGGSSIAWQQQQPPPPPPPRRTRPAAALLPDDADANQLSHVEPRTGRASMVDVSPKVPARLREARASCRVLLGLRAAQAVRDNALKKGDVLAAARLAGIMAAKKTSDLVPLCHPLLLSRVDVTAELEWDGRGGLEGEGGDGRRSGGGGGGGGGRGGGGGGGGGEEEEESAAASSPSPSIRVSCTARVGGASTGVEMEALTGAAVAALTVYDMVKAVGKGCVIDGLRLDYKVGGKSGAWARAGLAEEDAAAAAAMRRAADEAAG
jgi:molybdenum cofactor biosynthesis enzyme